MKRYTAQEMREIAGQIEYDRSVDYYPNVVKLAAMLRQAADDMERERKYEYACFGRVFQTLNGARIYSISNEFQGRIPKIFRREVGKWEEVQDES